ncbi:MAG: spore germination protein, partial [Bacilli bacterium]|nr:spore germination protein [Bacilli bacterium]
MRKLNPIRKASRKRTLGSRRQEEDQAASDDQNDRVGLNEDDSYQPEQFVLSDLQANKQYLQNFFTNASDVIIREARMVNGTSFLVLYVVGLVDTDHIDNRLMAPLMYGPGIENKLTEKQPETMKDLMELVVSFGQTKSLNSLTEGIDRLITGETLLFIDGFDE